MFSNINSYGSQNPNSKIMSKKLKRATERKKMYC